MHNKKCANIRNEHKNITWIFFWIFIIFIGLSIILSFFNIFYWNIFYRNIFFIIAIVFIIMFLIMLETTRSKTYIFESDKYKKLKCTNQYQ